jgi:N4-gp56 family major capsid protein
MSATTSADFIFTPKVWKDHIDAYFRRRLVAGAFALQDDTLKDQPGTTINFPYFQKIGAAEAPAEDEGLNPDALADNSFQATVLEIGKAVGVKKKAFKTSAASTDKIIAECQRQIGRVMAEKIDSDLIAEFSLGGNYTSGFAAASPTDLMSPINLNKARISAFGDLFQDAVVCFMHSLQFMDLMNSSPAGFLQANALDPMFLVQGFSGRLLGMAIVVTDNLGSVAGSSGTAGHTLYNAYIHKENAYGFIVKQDMEIESDYDILHREWIFTGNQWYAVKSFHAKISSQDLKTALVQTAVSTA